MLRSQGHNQGGVTSYRRRKEHRCDEVNPSTGLLCNIPFTRAWNLKRHKLDQHRDRGIVFINYQPTAAQPTIATPPASGIELPEGPRRSAPTMPAPAPLLYPTTTQVTPVPTSLVSMGCPQIRSVPKTPVSATPTPPHQVSTAPATISSSLSFPQMRNIEFSWSSESPKQDNSALSTPSPANRGLIRSPTTPESISNSPDIVPSNDPAQLANLEAFEHLHSEESEDMNSQSDAAGSRTPSDTDRTCRFEQEIESDEASRYSLELSLEGDTSGLGTPTDSSNRTCRKRKRSDATGRTIAARVRAEVPTYLVKRSKKIPGQQRGLGWLSASGKEHFDSTHASLLAQWGVKAGHLGTCVLIPEDWKALDSAEIMAIFHDRKLPPPGSGRAWYSYSDHATSLGRAAAWYGKPRKGADLDEFLGCGPYKPKDGSHLCHHEHCIIHLTYESADINMDRSNCCLEARFLRQDGREIPKDCTKHSPPCLMQVSQNYTSRGSC